MNQKDLGALRGEFAWLYGQEFLIMTPNGNFVWSSPEYGGTGEIFKTHLPATAFGEMRGKGPCLIGRRCGNFTYNGKTYEEEKKRL